MSLILRAYGAGNSPKSFPYGGRMGSYAEASSFEGFLPEVLKTATSYNLSAIITRNGHNLGSHTVTVGVDGAAYDVTVSACGERVHIDAPTIEVLRAAWNRHMAGVDEWIKNQTTGFSIIAHHLDAEGRPTGHAPMFGSFELTKRSIEASDSVLYELRAGTPCNDYELGTDKGHTDGVAFEITTTGSFVTITCTSLDVMRKAWGVFWDELQAHLARLREVAG